jgi:hypothetical protein
MRTIFCLPAESAKIADWVADDQGIVYRTVCQNPGCGFKFDLRITPENASLLSGSMVCPHCKRHGGQLKSRGRISEKLFAAKLSFRPTGVGPTHSDDDETEADSH